jgi:hypothetical protein
MKPDNNDGMVMQAKELDMLIIHMGMELNLHKTLCHFLVAQLQVELNLDKMGSNNGQGLVHVIKAVGEVN